MVVSAIISLGLPVALFLYWRKKYDLKIVPLLVGAATFILFALVLQQIMHFFVLSPNPDGSIRLIANDPAIFVLYGVLAAGIFEETGRFIAFHILKRKYTGTGTGLSYGIGHGGIEAILLAGLTMIGWVITSILINTGYGALLGGDPNVLAQVNVLIGSDSILFLASGIERIIAVAMHISLSMLVWCAVKVKSKMWLYPAAIILHAVFNIAPAMFQAGMLENIWVIEGILFILLIPVAIAAYFVCKIIKREDDKENIADTETVLEENITAE